MKVVSLALHTVENVSKAPKPAKLTGRINPVLPRHFTYENMTKAGLVQDKGPFTRAGRALMKYGNREGSIFPKPKGNPAQMNISGQKYLESIISDPERIVIIRKDKIEIYKRNGQGARFKKNGQLVTFVEGQYESCFTSRINW